MNEDKRWRREVVKECALFIPADTSQSLIHLEKGISQVTTELSAFRRRNTDGQMCGHADATANEFLVSKRISWA